MEKTNYTKEATEIILRIVRDHLNKNISQHEITHNRPKSLSEILKYFMKHSSPQDSHKVQMIPSSHNLFLMSLIVVIYEGL
jgi:hypothetical protein